MTPPSPVAGPAPIPMAPLPPPGAPPPPLPGEEQLPDDARARTAALALPLAQRLDFDGGEFPCSDAGNAELFARCFRDEAVYSHGLGKWLVWRGQWWAPDASADVLELALLAARVRLMRTRREDFRDDDAYARAIRWCLTSENRARLEAGVHLARTKCSSPADEAWDADPWLLGTATGVLDLRLGVEVPGERTDRISRHVPVGYRPDATAPRWESFLAEVFAGDAAVIAFVQRAVGYALTGDIREQVFFLCHGGGANGKSVWLGVLHDLLGPYAHDAGFATFERRPGQAASTIVPELMALDGRRVVTASETSDAAALNESRVKAIVGGDPVTGRDPYGPVRTFRPQCKLWLATNALPRVRDFSYGFWRRVRLIPFTQQFGGPGGREADPDLLARLQEEREGILAWAVRGCLAWQREGLAPPPAVVAATAEWEGESDPMSEYMATCGTVEGSSVRVSEGYRDYLTWCEREAVPERERLGRGKWSDRMGTRWQKARRAEGVVLMKLSLHAAPIQEANGGAAMM